MPSSSSVPRSKAVVVAEWWRGQRGPAARLLDAFTVEPTSSALAKVAGEVIDAVVALGRKTTVCTLQWELGRAPNEKSQLAAGS